MQLPEAFTGRVRAVFGNEGIIFLENLEETICSYVRKWSLEPEVPVGNLSYNYVLFVRRQDGTPAVFKAGVPGKDSRREILATESYRGNGCAALIRSVPEDGVQLLERIRPGAMLSTVSDEAEAARAFCGVWKRLRRPLPATTEFPSVASMWEEASRSYRRMHPVGGPVPEEKIRLAGSCFAAVEASCAGRGLLHGDLHHQNILLNDRGGWTAIDPHGYSGDPAYDLAPFLYNELEHKPVEELLALRTGILLDELQMSRKRLLQAALAMTVMSACWHAEEENLDAIRLHNRITDWYEMQLKTEDGHGQSSDGLQ
ncbi:aminoglycoside phosphotransferase family protein [Bhargavaea ullalensis]|uniref:Streptomycin 6-kinase n=1 Tax=Bhargavaea ullalensis TaxID=1265685 RepID=A0ABV2GCB8_9BACL